MARPWIVGILIGYGVIAAVAMIILGWPEATPAQVVLLELAALPLQAALGLGLWQLSRRMRPAGQRGRLALRGAAGLAGIGLAAVGLAYLTGSRGLVPAGLAAVWVALLAAMAVVVTHLPRRPLRTGPGFRLFADPAGDDDEEEDEDYDEDEDDFADAAAAAADEPSRAGADPDPAPGPVAPSQGDR